MKQLLFATIIISLFITGFSSCSTETDSDIPSKLIPDSDFYRANNLKFYYLDNTGKDLINPKNESTLPVTLSKGESFPDDLGSSYTSGNDYTYNRSWNTVSFDSEEGLYAFNTGILGIANKDTNRFYIVIKNQNVPDIIDTEFYITDKDVIGGKTYAFVKALYYNGKKVYSETDGHKWPGKIFIVKGNGKTTVYLSRP